MLSQPFLKAGAVLLTTVLLLSGCTSAGFAPASSDKKNSIIIGVAYGFSVRQDLFRQGLESAVAEVNSSGGVLGKNLELKIQDDLRSITQGGVIAQEFIEDPSVVAVIGHGSSTVSTSVAMLYDRAQLPLITPSSSAPKLTRMGLTSVFRGCFNDVTVAKAASKYAQSEGYARAVVLYTDDAYGRGLANEFEDAGALAGITVVDRVSYLATVAQYERMVRKWEAFGYDFVFVAAGVPDGIDYVASIRQAGCQMPIISGDGLDTPQLIARGGELVENMVIYSSFHPDMPGAKEFVEGFKRKFGVVPDGRAASGYDCVKLIAQALREAGSPTRDALTRVLQGGAEYKGVTGVFRFDKNGEPANLPVVRTVVKEGRFVFAAHEDGGR